MVSHIMFYNCTHMATVGVKGLKVFDKAYAIKQNKKALMS